MVGQVKPSARSSTEITDLKQASTSEDERLTKITLSRALRGLDTGNSCNALRFYLTVETAQDCLSVFRKRFLITVD